MRMALAAYRHVLRSTKLAFQGTLICPSANLSEQCRSSRSEGISILTVLSALGDERLLSAARHEARKGFDSKRQLTSSGEEAAAGIAHAEEVARILRQNVVQGQQVNEKGERYRTHEGFQCGGED